MKYQMEYCGYIYVRTFLHIEAESYEEALNKAPKPDEIADSDVLMWVTPTCHEVDLKGVDVHELEVDTIVNTESGEYKVVEGGEVV